MSEVVWLSLLVLGGMGLFLGIVLAVFGRIFAVESDPRVSRIERCLPGINCGVCGFAGCHAMAEGLVAGNVQPNKCAPGGQAVVQKVASILGTDEEVAEKCVAVVRCLGGKGKAKERAEYRGIASCEAADFLWGGSKACVYGCLGFGSCVDACPFGAIQMTESGLPEIIEEKCTGCGKCVGACPRCIITLIPDSQKIYVGCISKSRGKAVKEVCAVGCIGCGLCTKPKITPSGKVALKDNLPVFPKDWNDFETAVEKCPTNCFVVRNINH